MNKLLLALALLGLSAPAFASTPTSPEDLRFQIPYAAGGGQDTNRKWSSPSISTNNAANCLTSAAHTGAGIVVGYCSTATSTGPVVSLFDTTVDTAASTAIFYGKSMTTGAAVTADKTEACAWFEDGIPYSNALKVCNSAAAQTQVFFRKTRKP